MSLSDDSKDLLARKGVLSPQELADHLGVPVGTVYRWNYCGTGPVARRVGKHVRYLRSDVDAWLDSNVITHAG